MKQSAFAQVLACVASAYAAPQFSIPFSIPTSLPTGLPFSIPTSLPTSLIPSIPLPTGLGGLSLDANVARTPPIPPVVTRQTGSDAENDVVDNTGCKEVTLIFARGSLESGNMGSIIGPPLYTSLQSQLGSENVAAQGVDYDASIEGNAELGANGGPVMANYTQLALSQCPDTAVVLAGYSQGAMVVHNAAGQLTEGQFKAGKYSYHMLSRCPWGEQILTSLCLRIQSPSLAIPSRARPLRTSIPPR